MSAKLLQSEMSLSLTLLKALSRVVEKENMGRAKALDPTLHLEVTVVVLAEMERTVLFALTST